MLFRQNLLLTFIASSISLLLVTSVSVAQSTTADFRQPTSEHTSHVQHFAIMGEVVQPGVYELKSSSPLLSNIVRISGGLTKKASGSLRIIRQGRSRQQTYYTPSINMTLQPGDVILAKSKDAGESRHKVVKFSEQQNTKAKQPEQEYVQIGFINLITRPVVVKIPKDKATLTQIITMLGQPAETIKNVRVVSGSRQRQETSTLLNCSLVIFDKPVSSPDTIPDLPATLNEQQLVHAGPIDIQEPAPPQSALGSDNENQMKMKNTEPDNTETVLLEGPSLFNNDTNKNDTKPQKDDASQVILLPAPGGVDNIVSSPEVGDSHLIAEQDLPPQPAITPAAPIDLNPAGSKMMADKSNTSELDEFASSMDEGNFDDVVVPVQAVTNDTSSSNAITYALGLLLIVGGGVFVWAVAPRKTSIAASQQAEETSVQENMSLPAAEMVTEVDETKMLEALINNEMTIVTEQVILPVSLEFYGHPTGHEKLRIDAAHKMAEPHFKPSIPQPMVQDEISQKASATVAHGMRIDPPINLEGSIDATRSPLVSPAMSRTKKTFQ